MDNLEFNVYKKEDYCIGKWSGGTTTELGIYPSEQKYADRKFIWRLSSATVEVEESEFTLLPDYDRVLIVLDGEVVLVHKDVRVARLAKYEQDRFSGSYETKSFGKITDFNLMVKKGNQGFAEVVSLTEEYVPLSHEEVLGYAKANQSFYCCEGFCVVSFKNESCMLKEGELLEITYNYGDLKKIGVMGEGKVVSTQVYFNDILEESVEKESATETLESIIENKRLEEVKVKATFEDVKLTAIICWSNFRGGKFIFRSLKNVWYDEKLQRAIDKLERTMLPYILCLIGFSAVGFGAWECFGTSWVAPLLILWIVLDIVIINPLLYLRVVPKPVNEHMKKRDNLTEKEKEIEEVRKSQNPTVEKILKKYEITGRNKYTDE